MIITEKLENEYKNQIEIIKKEKNRITKMKMIGSLVMDVGGRCFSAVARAVSCSRKFVKQSLLFVKNGCKQQLSLEFRGRKKLIHKYPNLKKDIEDIISTYLSIKPELKDETLYVRLSIKETKARLIETGRYVEKSFSNSYLNDLVNQMGYQLKKVQKTKPLKKIKETNDIFKNVHEKKEQAMNDDKTVLISLDTKDKVLIGPFSRGGENRIQIEACDHNLTNDCLIPFGILDLKTDTPHFFGFTDKPTSLDLVDCIEEFWKERYANSKNNRLAILLDNGPDNSGVRTIFLKGLIEISKKYNISIELIYYPPYHSKYNPIERLWARLENIWNGFLLETVDICLKFMRNLTWKGIKSVTKLKKTKYEKGLSVQKSEMKKLEEKHILRKEGIKKWSIIITP